MRVNTVLFHLYDIIEQAKLICSEKKSEQWLPVGGVGARVDKEPFQGDSNVLYLSRVWS